VVQNRLRLPKFPHYSEYSGFGLFFAFEPYMGKKSLGVTTAKTQDRYKRKKANTAGE
jgi:hypothetical protein